MVYRILSENEIEISVFRLLPGEGNNRHEKEVSSNVRIGAFFVGHLQAKEEVWTKFQLYIILFPQII